MKSRKLPPRKNTNISRGTSTRKGGLGIKKGGLLRVEMLLCSEAGRDRGEDQEEEREEKQQGEINDEGTTETAGVLRALVGRGEEDEAGRRELESQLPQLVGF